MVAQSEALQLSWTKANIGIHTYWVRWRVKDTDPGTQGNQAGTWQGGTLSHRVFSTTGCPSNACSYSISGLTNSTTYEIQVSIYFSHNHWPSSSVEGTPMGQAAAPDAPTGLTVTPGNAQLSVSWTAPSGTVTGYDVHYTSNTSVAAGAAVQAGAASVGWKAVSRSGTTASQTISSLMNGTPYRVRVRAKNTNGDSAWVTASGTPIPMLVSNVGKATGGSSDTLSPVAEAVAQGFTTGANAGGYAVTGVDVVFQTAVGTPANLRVELWGADGSGDPDSTGKVSLTVPSTVGTGAVAFAAPSGTTLAASTTYFVVMYRSGATTGAMRTVSSNSEDSGGQSDWSIADAGHYMSAGTWTAWATGDGYGIRVKGTVEQATLSTNANLSGLTVGSNTSSTGTFTDFSIGTFGATTTTYTASVANDQTHVKLTPTVDDTGKATVAVRKGTVGSFTMVTSGSASSAIALDVGANTLVVRVTAEDTTTTKDYTVTVTRQAAVQTLSTDANLSGLTASSATSSGGPYSTLTLTPSSFSASRTSYTASVANARTHLKLTPTVADTGKATVTVDGNGVTSGTASGAIALNVGSNAITVRVTAEDTTTTKDYVVTVTRAAPPSSDATLSGLTASTSTNPTGTFTTLNIGAFSAGTTSYSATVANTRTHAKLTATVNQASATLTVGGNSATSGSPSSAIALNVGTNTITVRVTAQDSSTRDYTVTITRQSAAALPAVTLSASPNPVTEGSSVAVTATLTATLSSAVTIPLTITDNTAEPADHGTLASITINTGEFSGTGTITTNQDPDDVDETFTVALGTLPSLVEAGTPSSVQIRILDDEGIPTVTLSAHPNPVAEGSDARLTATLSEATPSWRSIEVPLRYRYGPTERSDLRSAGGIVILHGETTGFVTMRTFRDADTDDETFTVSVDEAELPSWVRAGSPSSVEVTITDAGGDDPPPQDPPPQDPPPQDPPQSPPTDGGGGGGADDDGSDPDGDDQSSGDEGTGEETNRTPETVEMIEAATLRAGAVLEIDLTVAFDDPDDDSLTYTAESSDDSVATVEVDDDTLLVRGLERGTVEITVSAEDVHGKSVSQTFIVSLTGPTTLWYLPSASNAVRQGFVRVVNHSDSTGFATITATDDAAQTYDPLLLKLEPRHAVDIDVDDLESGNSAKGLNGATGPGEGDWRLVVDSDTLDAEALAYTHTDSGFVSGMNAVATLTDGSVELPFFNPGSNVDQVNLLRLINPSDKEAKATVTGVDDSGASPGNPVQLTLAAGATCTFDAVQLESGTGLACGVSQDGIGDGDGNWRLTVASAAPLVAMNLLSDPDGYLTSLSDTASPDADDTWHVHLFPAANDQHGRQGVVRVINRSSSEGMVSIAASDDTDTEYEALNLTVSGHHAVHFQSDDLELGNKHKNLKGSAGSGTGTWRLALSSESIDIDANAYVSTADGFLTAMNAIAPQTRTVSQVSFFNSGDHDGVSVLRLVNGSTNDATVVIDGTDDRGLRPGTTVRVTVPATDAVELTAKQLESGEADAITSGALGDGTGRWRLRIDGAVTVLSLLSSPSGHLTNVSHAENSRSLQSLPAALLPPSATVTLESVGDRQLRARWSAVEGARYDVDVLRDGVRENIRSTRNTRSTAIRWWFRSPAGTYTIRVRSVNADGVRGPWSAPSNEIIFE